MKYTENKELVEQYLNGAAIQYTNTGFGLEDDLWMDLNDLPGGMPIAAGVLQSFLGLTENRYWNFRIKPS